MNRLFAPTLLTSATLLVALAACEQDDPGTEAVVANPPAEAASSVGEARDIQQRQGLLDPNRATREELLALEGVDRTLADSIVAGRPYDDMRGVDRVLSTRLREDEREAVYRSLWLPLDLNSATGEEILLIPGVGERLKHEFEEYRPYRGVAEFRREIGKYVDDAEVSRLERYVEVR